MSYRGKLPMLVGVFGVLVAALALLASGQQAHYLAFGAGLIAGGVVLGWFGATGRRLGRLGWLATGVLAAVGLGLSLLVSREEICCMYAYRRGQGYPWGWLDSGFDGEDIRTVERARAVAAADPDRLERRIDWFKVALDGVFWWYVAVPVVIGSRLALAGWHRFRHRPGRPQRLPAPGDG